MRGELYVIQLILLSEAAETHAVSLRPPGTARRASIVEELVSLPLDQAEARFADLAVRLPARLESEPPPHLTESHLAKLVKGAVLNQLGRVLGTTMDDALSTLLDPVPISREIEDVAAQIGLAQPLPTDAEGLLLILNAEPVRRAIRHRRGFGETEWGQHIEARRWILPQAMDLLETEAARRGWNDVTAPTDVLAGIIDHTLKKVAASHQLSGDRFDAMGIAYVRRRVENLANDMREEAVKHAGKARDTAPRLGVLSLLHGWIECYELQALARALLTLTGGTVPLGSLISRDSVELKAALGAPDPESFFRVENLKEFKKRVMLQRRDFVTCDVQCRLKDQSDFETVLRISDMPIEGPGAFEPIQRAIERLRGMDLSIRGKTIPERLLNTEVAAPAGLAGFLRRWVESHVSLVAQTLVLSGIDQPFQTRVPWDRQLKARLDFVPEQKQADLSFTQNARQRIIDAFIANCVGSGTQPRLEA